MPANATRRTEDLCVAQGDIGEACTSVVTEYRQKTEDHTAPITLEVEYLSSREIQDLIEELVWSYRKLFLIDKANDEGASRDEVGSKNISDKDYQRIECEAEHAWSALEAAFSHQSRFNRNMLSDNSHDAVPRIVDQLTKWSQDLEWPEGGSDGKWTSTADTADDCCEKTSIFMLNKFWPFTKIIRYLLASDISSESGS